MACARFLITGSGQGKRDSRTMFAGWIDMAWKTMPAATDTFKDWTKPNVSIWKHVSASARACAHRHVRDRGQEHTAVE